MQLHAHEIIILSHLNDPIFSYFLLDPTLVRAWPIQPEVTGSGESKDRCPTLFSGKNEFITSYPNVYTEGYVRCPRSQR